MVALFPETPAQARRRQLLEERELRVLATIPPHITGQTRRQCEAIARAAVAACTARQLAHMVWPWQPQPQVTRLPRGKQGVARAAAR